MAEKHVAEPFETEDCALMNRTEANRTVILSRLARAPPSRIATVMIARDQVVGPVQAWKELADEILLHREVTEVPNLVVGPNNLVVAPNHLDVHLVHIREGAAAVFENVSVSVMFVACEESQAATSN